MGTPPRIEATARARPPSSPATCSRPPGLWASTTTSARSASSAVEATISPPSSRASASARSASASATRIGSPSPRASAEPMLPAPMRPMTMRRKDRCRTPRPGGPQAPAGRAGSGLVVEALLDQPCTLLSGDLDVARCEHEDLFCDLLHATVERVGQARGEVDEALGELGVGALEVEDYRQVVLELVGHLLCVVEVLGNDEVDLDAGT